MTVAFSLMNVLQNPTAEGIWRLRADLVQAGIPAEAAIMKTLEEYHGFLCHLSCSMTAREFSHFASLLDIASIGGVVTETLVHAEDSKTLSQSLLGAVLSEGLMILATRQHVKAWEAEAETLYRAAAWNLYPEVWALSRDLRPNLADTERRHLLDGLFEPILSSDLDGSAKALVLGRLFQLVLVCKLAGWLKERPAAAPPERRKG